MVAEKLQEAKAVLEKTNPSTEEAVSYTHLIGILGISIVMLKKSRKQAEL